MACKKGERDGQLSVCQAPAENSKTPVGVPGAFLYMLKSGMREASQELGSRACTPLGGSYAWNWNLVVYGTKTAQPAAGRRCRRAPENAADRDPSASRVIRLASARSEPLRRVQLVAIAELVRVNTRVAQ